MENNDKNLYELGYLLIPVIPAEKLPEEASVLRSYVESNGGMIDSEGEPKMRKLSYEITHRVAGGKNTRYDDAHFGWLRFNISPENIKTIDSEMKKNTSVLRFMIINLSNEMGSPKRNEAKKTAIKKAKKNISEKEIDKEIDSLLDKEEANS